MESIIKNTEEKMVKSIETLKSRLSNIRTGRANAGLLDVVKINYYGNNTSIKEVALISVMDARTLTIKPYDKTTIGIIEKAIFEANIGLTPNSNGETIIINIPPLTEDRRKDYVKQAKTMCEEAKISLRNIRQDAITAIKKLEVSLDEEKFGNTKIQDLIDKYNKNIDITYKEKEEELMTI